MIDIYDKYSILSKFMNRAISLECMGINEFCWKYSDAIEVINYLFEHSYAVLGGDILIKEQGEYLYTYDNWFINKNKLEQHNKYLERCKNESIRYIEDYVKRKKDKKHNYDNFYFVIVFEENAVN